MTRKPSRRTTTTSRSDVEHYEDFIVVPVNPVTKPVWKAHRNGFGGHWGSKTYYPWLEDAPPAIEEASKDVPMIWEPIDIVVEVRPKKPKTTKLPFPKGDVDNFSKAILDACTDVLWLDDWQIRHETVFKEWSEGDGYFKVSWKKLPDLIDRFPVFNENRVQWEMAQDE